MGFGAFLFSAMENDSGNNNHRELIPIGAKPTPQGRIKAGWGRFGLGPCDRANLCELCQAAVELGEWVIVVARNAYLEGCEPWMVSDIVADYAPVCAADIERHGRHKRWHMQRGNLKPNAIDAVWRMAMARYQEYRHKSYDSRTADRMLELMAKMRGLISSGKTEMEVESGVKYEDTVLQARARLVMPRDEDGLDD